MVKILRKYSSSQVLKKIDGLCGNGGVHKGKGIIDWIS